jgi:hypothetical protein
MWRESSYWYLSGTPGGEQREAKTGLGSQSVPPYPAATQQMPQTVNSDHRLQTTFISHFAFHKS